MAFYQARIDLPHPPGGPHGQRVWLLGAGWAPDGKHAIRTVARLTGHPQRRIQVQRLPSTVERMKAQARKTRGSHSS